MSVNEQNTVQNETFYIEIENSILRKFNTNEVSIIESINVQLVHVKLIESDRLTSRLKSEISRTINNYKKIKNGYQKSKFDKKMKKIHLSDTEFQILQPGSSYTNTGKRIDNASKATRTRLVKKLETITENSLQFVESYGLIPKQLVCETFNGDSCVLNLDGRKTDRTSYDNLSSRDQEEVKSLLQVCDSAMISDAAYHEIAMRVPSIPRGSHIIACRNQINSQFDVKRTPGMLPGAYLSLETEIKNFVNEIILNGQTIPDLLEIKISGDGAKVSKVSNFIIVSFSVINYNYNPSHYHQRVLAIVNSDENYKSLDRALGPLFEEINGLNDKGFVTIDDSRVHVELFVGGDMKFIQLLLGLNSSISMYACPWCKVAKDNRGDISLPWDFYHRPELKRKIQEMQELAVSSTKNKYGTKFSPLLNIEVDHYVPDELHLLMRITDVMLRNLIDDATSKDQFAKINGLAEDNLPMLVTAIQSCGVTFKTWNSKTGELEYTSLNGNDKKKVLKYLPDKLLFCIHEDTRDAVVKLWRDFFDIYSTISDSSAKDLNSELLFSTIHKFLADFLHIGHNKREGYQKKNITPYLHVLIYHVPYFFGMYGGLANFSGQGVEKTNDLIKQIHQTKSNKIDATVDALVVRKRQELHYQSDATRRKRKYEKVNEQYWNAQKSELMKAKKQKIEREQTKAHTEYQKNRYSHNSDNLQDLSISELKQRLRDNGITTKLRKKEKLLELLKTSMN